MQRAWTESNYEALLSTGERAENVPSLATPAPDEFLHRVRTSLSVLQECATLLDRDLGGMMDGSSRQLMNLLGRAVADVSLCVDGLEESGQPVAAGAAPSR